MTLQQACDVLNWERHGSDLLWSVAWDLGGDQVAFGMARGGMYGPRPMGRDEAIRLAEGFNRAYRDREDAALRTPLD